MVGISGVSVSVKYGSDSLTIQKDGFLGEFADAWSFQLEVAVSPNAGNIQVFTVDGKKDITLKRVVKSGNDGQIYRLTISVVKSTGGEFFTSYPNNHLRLLKLETNGQFQIWEIAIVSQHSRFFLTTQQTMEAACYYQDSNQVVLPAVKWPQLLAFLKEHLCPENLPLISEFQKATPIAAENLKSGTGRTLWFNHAMQVGALVTTEGVARVHWSQINRGNGSTRNFLKTGELVLFQNLERPNKGDRKTTFQLEARQVSLITQ